MSNQLNPDQNKANKLDHKARHYVLKVGLFVGVGIVGSLDAIVFHELLQWHNFYVHTDQFWRIFIEGLFHTVTVGLLLIGLFMVWYKRELLGRLGNTRALIAGILLGMGGFNLYDGIIQHKLLQLHQVRENVPDIWPYDLAWNGVALVLLGLGTLSWRSVARRDPPTRRKESGSA